MTATPKISVVLVTRNHADYLEEAIRSVLLQTHQNFELLLVDSGSTDKTPSILSSYADPRVQAWRVENRGPGSAMNEGLSRARGDYIALMSGDDAMMPTRLEEQLRAFQKTGPSLVFSHVHLINDQSRRLEFSGFYKNLFNVENRSRTDWLRCFLQTGNCLNATTFFTSRACLEKLSAGTRRPFHPLLFQLQDFDLWLRALRLFPLHVIPEALMRYRVRGGGNNLSAPSRASQRRSRNESFLILQDFIRSLDDVFDLPLSRQWVEEQLLSSPHPAHHLAAIVSRYETAQTEEMAFSDMLAKQRIFFYSGHPQEDIQRLPKKFKSFLRMVGQEIRGLN